MKHVIALLFVAFAAVLVTSCSDTSIENAVNSDVEYTYAEQAAEDAKNTYCDSLHFELRKHEKGSEEAKAIFALIKDSCEKVRKPNPCDSLRKKLRSLDKDSDEFKNWKIKNDKLRVSKIKIYLNIIKVLSDFVSLANVLNPNLVSSWKGGLFGIISSLIGCYMKWNK